jgi:signal transduction histidine kinase
MSILEPPQTVRRLLKNAIVAIAYFSVAKLGLTLMDVSPGATPVWSPMGVGIAALLVWGYGCWPGIYVGALCAEWNFSGDLGASLLLAVGKPLQSLLGVWLTNRFANGCKFFERPWDVLKFGVLAGMISPLLSPPIGVENPKLNYMVFWSGTDFTWFSCWLGKLVSVLLLTPLIVTWHANPRFLWKRTQVLEYSVLLALLIFAAHAIFGELSPEGARTYLLPNFCLPFLVWAAFRFGPRETTTATFFLSIIALLGTMQGFGLYARAEPEEALLVYQSFIAANSWMALAVAAVIAHRNQYRAELQRARDELELRVRQRTLELSEANRTLQTTIRQKQKAQEAHAQVLRLLDGVEDAERHRISRELHDRLGQELTAAKLAVNMIKKLSPMALSVEQCVKRLEQLMDSLMRNVHRLAWELRPAVLDDFGLSTTLRRYAKEWTVNSGVEVDFHDDNVAAYRLPPHLEITLYRISQEALTNVFKHAKARRVCIVLERRSDHVQLIVEDDGRGFDVEDVIGKTDPHAKLGLLGMHERVMLVGGTLDIESTPEKGTAVFVRIPLAAKNA